MFNELSEAGFRAVLNGAKDREEDITKLQIRIFGTIDR